MAGLRRASFCSRASTSKAWCSIPITPRVKAMSWPRILAPACCSSGLRWSARYARSEEHTSELQSLMRISYAVFCLKKKKKQTHKFNTHERYEYNINRRMSVNNITTKEDDDTIHRKSLSNY